jgi:4,5-DOPA dioxygenase extradiol
MVDWQNLDSEYDWAKEANQQMKTWITEGNYEALIDYQKAGKAFKLAIPTPEHYLPMLYALALKKKTDEISFFNDKIMMGSLSMTSVMIG